MYKTDCLTPVFALYLAHFVLGGGIEETTVLGRDQLARIRRVCRVLSVQFSLK